jgi:predicted AAA+ superfamily ATPase
VYEDLWAWLTNVRRRPLILRGARQVGKTWLVRELARARNLALLMDHRAAPADSLLFIDEIQAAPEVLARLRWFAEEMPELPVVEAGSLLEFALADFSHSMPVGRVSYAYVKPLGFPEYLEAHAQQPLLERLRAWQPGTEISSAVHQKAWEWFNRYHMVGGMPAVVAADAQGADAKTCRALAQPSDRRRAHVLARVSSGNRQRLRMSCTLDGPQGRPERDGIPSSLRAAAILA